MTNNSSHSTITVCEFVSYWQNIRTRTMRVARFIPESRFDWSPGSGAMSFADILRHLAVVERWMFVETVLGRPSRYWSHGPECASGREDVLTLMSTLHADSTRLLRELSESALQEEIRTPAGARVKAWKWLRAMVEHEVHHRGQLYLMLRLCDVETPPIFGLTSEQLRAR